MVRIRCVTGLLNELYLINELMEWTVFFACWCKFRKAKSCFTDFWAAKFKNGHFHLVHESLKCAEWLYELSWFFACWLRFNNFWVDEHCTLYLLHLNASILPVLLKDHVKLSLSILPPVICLGVSMFQSWFNDFWVGMVKNCSDLFSRDPKIWWILRMIFWMLIVMQ